MVSDGWVILSAIATALSAIVVATQAWYTRRSVRQTSEALRLSRAEFERGEKLRLQAERARIDSEMPRLSVTVAGEAYMGPAFPGWEPVIDVDSGHYEVSPFVGREFVMPRDGAELLEVRLDLELFNDGPRRAPVTIGTPQSFPPESRELVLDSGSGRRVTVTVARTLSRWIEIYEQREAGVGVPDEVVFELGYIFPGDASAIEHHLVVAGGTVVESVEGNAAGWRVVVFDPGVMNFRAATQPFTRDYWASRIDNQRL